MTPPHQQHANLLCKRRLRTARNGRLFRLKKQKSSACLSSKNAAVKWPVGSVSAFYIFSEDAGKKRRAFSVPVLSSKYRRQMGGWINQCVFIFSDDARPCQMAGRIIAGCVLPDDGRLLLLCSVGTPKEMMQPCLIHLHNISLGASRAAAAERRPAVVALLGGHDQRDDAAMSCLPRCHFYSLAHMCMWPPDEWD